MKKLWLSLMVVGLMLAFLPVSAAAAPGDATNPAAMQELAQARQATTKYHDVSAALADGYLPVSLFVPGMGVHYLRFSPGPSPAPDIDATFEVARPEILLYAENGPNGQRLVGVEYVAAGPAAPPGFTGDDDVWDIHPASCHYVDGYEIAEPDPAECPATSPSGAPLALWHPDLWALHVWLWEGNPDGIFAPVNPNLL